MVELIENTFQIDGKPQIVLCGEIHYFRLDSASWQDRIDKLKKTGCNAVASYVPWICHEEEPGLFDLQGRTRPELNLWQFIDLCQQNNLYFIIRPGPFIMAEMKNEGLPGWLYQQFPEIVPRGWDNKPCSTKNVDLLAPSYLIAAQKWYAALIEGLLPRLQPAGGNIIAFQLDNEIGMLSWVSNSPDLSSAALDRFFKWLSVYYDKNQLRARYSDCLERLTNNKQMVLSPPDSCAVQLWNDLARFLRSSFAEYVNALRDYARKAGIRDIPFIINIHGTAGGRALQFPVGISQLQMCYQNTDILPGSDLYLGNLDRNNFHDLYMVNALLKASMTDNKPISSAEFEAGDGDYGQTLGGYDQSAFDLKLRMAVAQGNRLINIYLFAGGHNYRFNKPIGDGDDRIAFTGERHGFAAPVGPEGQLNRTYSKLCRSTSAIKAVTDWLADSQEITDNLHIGFISEYYATECHYPGSKSAIDYIACIERCRAGLFWDSAVRSVLLGGYRFKAADLKLSWPKICANGAIILPSARFMASSLQKQIAEYLISGGQILLLGELPSMDLDRKPCTLLIDTLGIKNVSCLTAGPEFYLTVQTIGLSSDIAEYHAGWAQIYDIPEKAQALFAIYPDKKCCGFQIKTGEGKLQAITTETIGDIGLYAELLHNFGIEPGLANDDPDRGLFATMTANGNGGKILHVLNLDDKDKTVKFTYNNQPLLGNNSVRISGKSGLLLPMGVHVMSSIADNSLRGYEIVYSTAEICSFSETRVSVYQKNGGETIVLRTKGEITVPGECKYVKQNDKHIITFPDTRWEEKIQSIDICYNCSDIKNCSESDG